MIRAWIIIGLHLLAINQVIGQLLDKKEAPYRPDQIVIKWSSQASSSAGNADLQVKFSSSLPKPVRKQVSNVRSAPSVLDNIYIFDVPEGTDILAVCDSLNKSADIIYAEPIYLETLLLTPNDPAAQPEDDQFYLETIDAYRAWDISTGDSAIIVGVIDTGSDLLHEDLVDNYSYNTAENENGFDDDANGYIDDYIGYDFANQDNDPTADKHTHGTRVAGVIGATTNNQKGMASIGYNTSIRPLKIFTSENNTSFGSYTAIQYAADNDYDVINLSWGSIDNYSQFSQDIITYAVIEKDVVVVAAAGNTPEDLPFYPASYDYVLSVGASTAEDTKASFATWNRAIDLVAPGVGIYSTENNNAYGFDNGSSYAAPLTAGVAALLRAHRPDLSALQITERIKASTDPIYQISENEPYLGKLGSGRLNAYQALTASYLTSLDITTHSIQTSYDQIYFGDTITYYIDIENKLDPVYFLEAEMISNSPYVIPLDSVFSIGYLGTGEVHTSGPFRFRVASHTPADTPLPLLIHLSDEQRHESFHAIDFIAAPDYLDLANDSIALTVSASGRLGYNKNGFFEGSGLSYDHQLSNHTGFYVQFNDSTMLDNLQTIPETGTVDDDFEPNSTIRPHRGNNGEYFTFSTFSDTLDRIYIENYSVIWDSLPGKALGLSYRISNQSSDTIYNVHAGIFSDLNVTNAATNQAIILGDSVGLIRDSLDHYAGMAVMADSIFFSIADQSSLPDTLQDIDKIEMLTSVWNDSLGFESYVDASLSSGIFVDTLFPGTSYDFQVIIAAGDSLSQIQLEIAQAKARMDAFTQTPIIDTLIYSCEGGSVYLIPDDSLEHYFFSDPLGLDTLALNDSLFVNQIQKDTMIYAARVHANYTETIKAYQIKLLENIANFHFEVDTLFLGDFDGNKIQITDLSFEPLDWTWDFGNGTQAVGIQNPRPSYNTTGSFDVSLDVENAQGCTDQLIKTLTVLERPPTPILGIRGYCPEETINITHPDTLNFYPFENSSQPLLRGMDNTIGPFHSDTTIFVSKTVNGLESRKTEVQIVENPITLTTSIIPFIDSLSGFWAEFSFSETYVASANWQLETIQSTGLRVPYQLLSDTLNFEYEAVTDSGCLVFHSETLVFSASPTPDIDDMEICLGDDLVLSPGNGNLFGFYADSLFQNPLIKGTELNLDSLTNDTIIFVVGLDSMLPGMIQPVEISVVDYTFHIETSQDSLYLNLGRSIDFTVSETSETVRWYIDSIYETSSLSPTLFFNQEGRHLILAEGMHASGCSYSDTTSIFVFEEYIEPLHTAAESIRMYPIPAFDQIHLEMQFEKPIKEISVTDLTGKSYPAVLEDAFISLRHVPDGIFVLKIKFLDGNSYSIKGIKKSF
jgi:subtilisin family serine protease/PKD repeat protein